MAVLRKPSDDPGGPWSPLASVPPQVGVVIAVAQAHRLTSQETRILEAATRGLASKEVAFYLRISRRTVDYYWRQIFTKLGCRSQLEVLALLLRRAVAGPGPTRVVPRRGRRRNTPHGSSPSRGAPPTS